MGLKAQNQEFQNIPLKEKLFEIYPEENPDIFYINFY